MKRSLHILLLVVFLSAVVLSVNAFAQPVAGDVDGDDLVNAVDVQLVINGALGMSPPYRTDLTYDEQDETNAIDGLCPELSVNSS